MNTHTQVYRGIFSKTKYNLYQICKNNRLVSSEGSFKKDNTFSRSFNYLKHVFQIPLELSDLVRESELFSVNI